MSDSLLASLIGLGLSFVTVLPAPDSISAADRLHLLHLASEPAAAPAVEASTGRQVIWGAEEGNLRISTFGYACLFNAQLSASSEGLVQVPAGAPGTLSNWRITLAAAPGLGKSYTFYLRVNGVSAGASITISGTDTTGRYTGAGIPVTAAQLLSVLYVPSGTPTTGSPFNWSIEFEPTVAGTSIYGGPSGGGNEPNWYSGPFCVQPLGAHIFSHARQNIAACAGTLTALRMFTTATGTYRAYINKNGVTQDGTGGTVDTELSMSGAGTHGVTFSLPVAAGDLLYIEVEKISGSGGSWTVATAFVATTPGQFHVCGGAATALPTSDTRYTSPENNEVIWSLTEDTRDRNIAGAITTVTLSGFRVASSAAPGAGDSWAFTTRKNEANTDIVATIADAAEAAEDLAHSIEIADGDRFSLQCDPTGTPANSQEATWAWIGSTSEAEPEPTPEVPPGVNPAPGDPVGAIYFARIVHTGDQVEQRGECTIRNPAELWGGKIPSGLLKVSKVSLRAVEEGLPTAECTIELDDTPDPITGESFWRTLSATAPLEGAFVEVFRCHAPYGIILGTPWRYFAGRVPEGGHYPIDGFRYGFRFVDVLGELFDDPKFRKSIPGEPLTVAYFPGMLESFDGKVPPLVLGNCVTDGEGVVRMIPMGRINILAAFGSGLDLEVGVGLIARQAVYDVVEGYYNILTWEASKPVFAGEERRPTIDNPGYGFIHRAQNAATTGAAEPQVANGNAWATTVGGTTTDGAVTWINAGIDDVTSRRRIPNEMYGAAGGLAVPHKPGWAAVTGAAPGNPNVPGEYVIYGAPNRAYTPVFWDLTHPYSPYVESGQIELLFDVVGAMTSATSGTPILSPVYLYVHVLLNYGWSQTDGITYVAMPMLPGLTGEYSVFDMDTAAAVKAAHDALGGLINGLEVAPDGEPEDLWSVLDRLQKFGRFRTLKNRHGQIGFAFKDYTATPTLVFDEIRDQITVKERPSTERRGIGVEFLYGKRYVPHVPAPTPNPGQPLRGIGGRVKGDWVSGLNQMPHAAAAAALATSYGRDRTRPINLEIDTTRDGGTAQLVAEFARDEGTGPAPYDGIRVFEFTGPFERVLMREGTDSKTLQPGACIAITNAEGMSAQGYVNKPAFVIEVEPDAETDRARVVVEILPDEES